MSEPRRVLVVEDNAANAELAALLLSLGGWRVGHAPDGAVALERLAAEVPDVVLLDLLLPRVDGLALLREMAGRPALRAVPVVVFTAAGDDMQAQALAAHPGVTVLRKPARAPEILGALDAAAGKGAPRDPA